MCFDTTAKMELASCLNKKWRKICYGVLVKIISLKSCWEQCIHSIASFIPDIHLFKRFKQNWNNIDQTSFNKLESYPQKEKEEIIQFFARKLNQEFNQSCNDYKELLELAPILLGGTPFP